MCLGGMALTHFYGFGGAVARPGFVFMVGYSGINHSPPWETPEANRAHPYFLQNHRSEPRVVVWRLGLDCLHSLLCVWVTWLCFTSMVWMHVVLSRAQAASLLWFGVEESVVTL